MSVSCFVSEVLMPSAYVQVVWLKALKELFSFYSNLYILLTVLDIPTGCSFFIVLVLSDWLVVYGERAGCLLCVDG